MNDEIKTHNSFFSDKVHLRLNYLPDKESIKVLDAFAGEGLIWKAIKRESRQDIDVLGIDIDGTGFCLPGDNRKYLTTMNLNEFDVIDLDAFGVPYDQMKILFDRKYKGTVFVTFIQSQYGQMPHGLLADIGFSKKQIKAIPTVYSKNGWLYAREWLAAHGVREIIHRSHLGKHYFVFGF